jgi:hypothetical protein
MIRHFATLVVCGAVLWLVFQAVSLWSETRSETATIRIGGTPVVIELADSEAERERGLSGRRELRPGFGMLFVFEEETRPSFWMKDMRFSIDIIWISADGRVVDIDAGVLPESYPQTFTPDSPVRYVLEVPAGFSEAEGITIGSRLGR